MVSCRYDIAVQSKTKPEDTLNTKAYRVTIHRAKQNHENALKYFLSRRLVQFLNASK